MIHGLSYVPSYMMAAFAKRLCRLALTAPPSGCLFILALTFNLIRRHPTLLPLIHRPLTAALQQQRAAQAGAATSASSNLALKPEPASESAVGSKRKESEEAASLSSKKSKLPVKKEDSSDDDPEDDDAENESEDTESSDNDEEQDKEEDEDESTVKGLEAAQASALAMAAAILRGDAGAAALGVDPFDESCDHPEKCSALDSSLWEIKSLCNHYIWQVSQQAKIFEAENAPKHDYELSEFADHSYHSVRPLFFLKLVLCNYFNIHK
jgi:DNA mismatch repair ATPase MutL